MLFGLTVKEIIVLAAVVLGGVLLILGVILAFKEQKITRVGGQNEIKIPVLGMLKINGVATLVLLIGAALVGFPAWKSYDSPPTLPISGKIQLAQGKPISGVVIGVLPSSHTTLTQPDGRYSINVPKGEKGISYQAVLYLANSNPPFFHLDVVTFNADGQGSFDYTLGGSNTK